MLNWFIGLFHVHNYGKWVIKSEHLLVDENQAAIGKVVYQQRTCDRCGYVQMARWQS